MVKEYEGGYGLILSMGALSKGLVFEVDWISGLVVGEYEGVYGLNIGV